MKKIFVKHHLGLGDCIVHNGMVRNIIKNNNDCEVYVATKHHNYENIKFMYRDDERIKILLLDDAGTNIHLQNTPYDRVVYSHFDNGTNFTYNIYGDDSFYLHAGFDPKIRIKDFYLKRDYQKELNLYHKLIDQVGSENYIFIHEKPEQNIKIDMSKIKTNLPIIYANPEYNFFDLLTTIERANEVHVISSCFLSYFMINKINKKIFAHMYADRNDLIGIVSKSGIDVVL
jgi:hypothetical protein